MTRPAKPWARYRDDSQAGRSIAYSPGMLPTPQKYLSAASAGFLCLLAAACTSENAPKPVPISPNETAQLPPGHPPTSGANAGTAMPRPADLSFTTPAGWQIEPPSNAMRKLQIRLPRADSDTEDAELWTTGPVGGTREANIERWANEFEQPDGRATKDVASISNRKVGELEVLEFDVTGTALIGSMMSAAAPVRKEGWRQIAVSITRDGQNLGYVRARGPVATVTKWEASIRGFVDSATLPK